MPYKDKAKEKEHRKIYYEKNKDRLKNNRKEYLKENKERLTKKDKERRKNQHMSAIEKICDYYSIKKPICFFDKKEIPFFKSNGNKTNKNYIVLDHKFEKETGSKDEYAGYKLKNHIINSKNNKDLGNYQLLCRKHNLDKKEFFAYCQDLKRIGNKDADKMLEIYNELFIFDKEKLHKQLREMGKEELIKDGDDYNGLEE